MYPEMALTVSITPCCMNYNKERFRRNPSYVPGLLFTGSVMIVFLGFYYFPDTIPGIVLQPPKKGAFSTKKYWYLYK
jgi:hypothetical protein